MVEPHLEALDTEALCSLPWEHAGPPTLLLMPRQNNWGQVIHGSKILTHCSSGVWEALLPAQAPGPLHGGRGWGAGGASHRAWVPLTAHTVEPAVLPEVALFMFQRGARF